MRATYEDRYGLPLSAQGWDAAEHYMEGIDRALALTAGAQASLEAALQAYLRARRYAQAEHLLRKRLARRPSARDTLWLQQAQRGGITSPTTREDAYKDGTPPTPCVT
jgi:Tfp pilus assembly protein PilF